MRWRRRPRQLRGSSGLPRRWLSRSRGIPARKTAKRPLILWPRGDLNTTTRSMAWLRSVAMGTVLSDPRHHTTASGGDHCTTKKGWSKRQDQRANCCCYFFPRSRRGTTPHNRQQISNNANICNCLRFLKGVIQMTTTQELAALGPIARYEQNIIERITDFNDPRQEWRRLFSELLGTFFLVLAAAGGGMMGHAFPGVISRTAAVVAPALTVLAIILFMGKVSGAHLNPAVSIAFALRRDFPWQRVPGYIVVQLIGATLAALFLRAVVTVSAIYGSNYPAHGHSDMAAFWMELILTTGLVSVILGTASGAQNIGLFGAFGVGGYIALAGLWGSPISGASMNPARTFGPDLVGTTFTGYWVYVTGPIAGAALAVVIAFVLRGPGGGKSGSGAAQGDIFTETYEAGKS